MENSGKARQIHVSAKMVQLLIGAGMAKWIALCQENIVAIGKGELQTSKHCQCNLPPSSTANASPDTSYAIAANLS